MAVDTSTLEMLKTEPTPEDLDLAWMEHSA
jgi:hypothetical protein